MPPALAAPVAEDESEVERLTLAKGEAIGCAGISVTLLLIVASLGLFLGRSGLSTWEYWSFLLLVIGLFAVGFGAGFWTALRLEWGGPADRRKRDVSAHPEGAKPPPLEGFSTLGPAA